MVSTQSHARTQMHAEAQTIVSRSQSALWHAHRGRVHEEMALLSPVCLSPDTQGSKVVRYREGDTPLLYSGLLVPDEASNARLALTTWLQEKRFALVTEIVVSAQHIPWNIPFFGGHL